MGGATTDLWLPQHNIADQVTVMVPASAGPGEYTLVVGLYDSTTLARPPVHRRGQSDPRRCSHAATGDPRLGLIGMPPRPRGGVDPLDAETPFIRADERRSYAPIWQAVTDIPPAACPPTASAALLVRGSGVEPGPQSVAPDGLEIHLAERPIVGLLHHLDQVVTQIGRHHCALTGFELEGPPTVVGRAVEVAGSHPRRRRSP